MVKYTFPEGDCRSCAAHAGHYTQTKRICNGGKKPRRFKSKDPKRKAPAWCPKRNNPAKIRVFRLKDEGYKALHLLLRSEPEAKKLENQYAFPFAHRYKAVYACRQKITAKQFHAAAKKYMALELIDFGIEYGDVVEINDGLKPYFFYFKGCHTFQPAYFTPQDDETPETAKRKKGTSRV